MYYIFEGSHKAINVSCRVCVMCMYTGVIVCRRASKNTQLLNTEEDSACSALILQNQVLTTMWSYVS